MFEFDNGGGSLTGHVVNSVLVTEPVRTLDGIVHVPSPVILVHVSESSIDTTLGGDSVASSREKLGDTGSVETSLGKAECSSQTRATSTNDDSIVLVILKIHPVSQNSGTRLKPHGGTWPGNGHFPWTTYNDGVFAADERRRLLGSERSIGDNSSCLQVRNR